MNRADVIEAIRTLDRDQAAILSDSGSYADPMDEVHGVLTPEAGRQIRAIDEERRRLVGYLQHAGGLPAGMTKTF